MHRISKNIFFKYHPIPDAVKCTTIVIMRQIVPNFWSISCHTCGNATEVVLYAVYYVKTIDFSRKLSNIFVYFSKQSIMVNGVVPEAVQQHYANVTEHYRIAFVASTVLVNVPFAHHHHYVFCRIF